MSALSHRRLSAGNILFLLFLANVLNYADRALLGVVVDPVKYDLALSDTEISIVSGAVFTIFNLVMGLYIARWVDIGNRKRILLVGIILWTAATALTGAAQGFWTLAICRVLVGVGEATCFPVAISMLADLYTRDRRPRAFAIFQSSVFLGIVAGSILAGVLAAAHGWRYMFAICGIAGVALVLLIGFTMREPTRTHDTPDDGPALAPEDLGRALPHLFRVPGFAMLCLGVGISAMPIAILPIWAPTFLMRSHDVPLASVGALIGLPVGIGGVVGTVLAGMLASAICRRRGDEYHGLLVPIAALPACRHRLHLLHEFPAVQRAGCRRRSRRRDRTDTDAGGCLDAGAGGHRYPWQCACTDHRRCRKRCAGSRLGCGIPALWHGDHVGVPRAGRDPALDGLSADQSPQIAARPRR